jgi:chemotaxis protein methyltransferase CheR
MEAETYESVKSSIKQLLGIDLSAYKDQQMRRRLDSWLTRTGEATWPTYLQRLRLDKTELSKFRDYLTINVKEFFRDPDRWHILKRDILPDLIKQAYTVRPGRGGIRAWSAGCSIGAEPYSLAMYLADIAPGQPHQIIATDLDRGILARARAGGPYIDQDIRAVPAEYRQKYFAPGGPPYFMSDKLIKHITFNEQNLLSSWTENGFDLIICRNVIIYFTADAKMELYQKFYNALRPGGILFLGGTEMIPRPADIGFKSPSISFYQKAGK